MIDCSKIPAIGRDPLGGRRGAQLIGLQPVAHGYHLRARAGGQARRLRRVGRPHVGPRGRGRPGREIGADDRQLGRVARAQPDQAAALHIGLDPAVAIVRGRRDRAGTLDRAQRLTVRRRKRDQQPAGGGGDRGGDRGWRYRRFPGRLRRRGGARRGDCGAIPAAVRPHRQHNCQHRERADDHQVPGFGLRSRVGLDALWRRQQIGQAARLGWSRHFHESVFVAIVVSKAKSRH
jgi:hypothetical protein